jgi:isocitrate dehydrogenase (NAD+)
MAMMLSAAMMLRHIGEAEAAGRIERGIAATIAEGRTVTYDLKADPRDITAATTMQVADAVCNKVKEAIDNA